MIDATRLLEAAAAGDRLAAAELLPLVYDELRKVASARLADERLGQTLQPTALVHEAYLRLMKSGHASAPRDYANRGHFFAAAAEAMRRILVERARGKRRIKRGGGARRQDLDENLAIADKHVEQTLAVHEALDELERHDPQAATLVKLRFFVGLGHQEAAEALGLSRRAADGLWLLARTWLFRMLRDGEP